jgi:NADPH-ferrihemoprotein reductase
MSDTETIEAAAKEAWLGLFDWIILGICGAAVFWYFFLRKKKDEYQFNSSSIKPISPVGGSYTKSDDSGFVAKLKSSGRNVVVFYGSQTGTAEDLANRLAKDAQRFGLKGVALDPEECDMDDLPKISEIENALVIFCLATYGEGDPTDNAQEFYEFLQRGDSELNGLNYAVFGLGNKTYEHYNAMATYTDKRLAELGAKRVYEIGMGDDDGNLEEDFLLWREGFWPAVCDVFDIRTVGEDISTRQYKLTVHGQDLDGEKVFKGEMARLRSYETQKPPFDQKNPFMAPVSVNRELHTGGDRSCKHVEFDISGSRLRYEAGDHVAVYASNDKELVEKFGTILNVDLNTVFTLTNVDEDSSKKHPFPCPCTYRTALLHYVDITCTPRTNVVKEMAEYCTDEEDKRFLLSMTSTKEESRKKFSDWIVADHRTVLDILEDVPSCRPPLDHLLELMPRLQARYYSISSSPKDNADAISVTAVLVKYKSRLDRTVRGVATTFLNEKSAGVDRVPIFVRKSQLRLPHQSKIPIIMIGPGTGLAPFRGFLQDRYHQRKSGKEVGQSVLYYGCRRSDQDYLYKNELESWLADGTLNELHVAFSRQQTEKVYVQHLLRQNKESTWKLLQQGGHIYVCGDAKNMSRDVQDTFADICMEVGKMSADEAKAYMKKMESQKRYQADVWS